MKNVKFIWGRQKEKLITPQQNGQTENESALVINFSKATMEWTSKLKQIAAALLIFLSLSVFSGYAQQSATEGTDFYVTFNYNQGSAATPTLQIRYVVTKACRITAEYGRGGYLDNNVLYLPGVYSREIPSADRDKCYNPGSPDNRYIRIRSDENIGVYALNMRAASTDVTAVLPVSKLGKHYTILSTKTSATYDSSYITIIAPSGTVFSIKDSDNNVVVSNQTLNSQNPVYNYMGPAFTDLTGYTVESSANIAVFSVIPRGATGYTVADLFWEQMWPTNTAGRSFFLWDLSGSGDFVKLVGLEDNTEVTEKIGTQTKTLYLNKNKVSSLSTTNSRLPTNRLTPVRLTSDKPFIVEHIVASSPALKWWNSTEQRITKAVVSPFIATGGSLIKKHYLHIMIPAGSENYMTIREIRNGIVGSPNPRPTFSTNNTDPNYLMTQIEYDESDDVLIELENPAGFLAYMTGKGVPESYIFTAGSGAFNLSSYFTVQTKTIPYMDTYYADTDQATHTFAPGDSLLLKRVVGNPIEVNHQPAPVTWWLNNDTKPVTLPSSYPESKNLQHTVKIPSSSLQPGENEVHMHVRYAGASKDSIYTGKVWRYQSSSIPVNPHIRGFFIK